MDQYAQTSMSYVQENNLSNSSRRIFSKKLDSFEETYKIFVHSIVNNYFPTVENRNTSLNYCPPIPPDLQGPLIIHEVPKTFSLTSNSSYHTDVQFGGYYQPKACLARHKVAIIVPYRDRWDILTHFLFHTHQILQRQQLDYRIYVCEQAFNTTFNKGIVMNGCFKEILKLEPDTPCFIMHDVDLLLIDDRNMYTCPLYPRHLSVAVDKFKFYLPYAQLVGGVLAMRREHYLLVNGYSTNYWGWGGEDDDMHARIVKKHLKVERPPTSIARYKMLKHTHQKLNPARMKVLRTAHIRIDSDGVNNVKYNLLNTTFYHLYTHFLIDVGEQPK
ncbi:unnamed protein product [Rotaria socialis]|uniref:Beta-1,4-galactosyltransferase n=1 Tax=Rotaria socialis TaxID=392032 RepID=A0A817RC77_9BILA|nr:unnamed protein product [Rotaria socialis]CAF3338529.1 unnamed protein product [Rotaria socialis]CAF3397366.1 unnamed protein product [Rotaria socialis]CAF3512773.1 unnamed protein product [Rotaria socialis]CAF3709210.1 unnamed protein product [Rotaria socialis]